MVSTADHTAILAVDSRCTHGEGVLWCEQREALYWVDISEKRLWRHHPGSAQTRFWTLPDRPGCIGLMDDGRVLIALAKAICIADPDNADGDTLALDHLADVEADNPLTRSNDGRADRHGNFVFGTMDEHEDKAGRGAMYQFSLRHGLRRLPLPGVSIPNSICFSPDGRTLYYCDSVRPQILRCDYDPDTAQTSNTRVFTTWIATTPSRMAPSSTTPATCGTRNGAPGAWCGIARTAAWSASCRCRSSTPPAVPSAVPHWTVCT